MFTIQTKLGTAGGTLFTLLFIPWTDILRTFVLSGVAAATSFLVSLLLQHLFRKKKT
jgi:predicted membrane-bound spermidine synthase